MAHWHRSSVRRSQRDGSLAGQGSVNLFRRDLAMRSWCAGLARKMLLLGAICWAMGLMFAPGSDAYIYWTQGFEGSIGRASLDGSDPDPDFITGPSVPQGLAVDSAHGHIYWADAGRWTIGRANVDGSGYQQDLIGAFDPQAVTFDDNYVYYAGSTGGFPFPYYIGRANLDGTEPDRFINGYGSYPATGLAVDDTSIYIASSAGDILKGNLDGPNVHELYTAPGIQGVAVAGNSVYWTESGSIKRANRNGSGPKQSLITGLDYPAGLAVHGNHMYWTESVPGSIGRANLDGSDPDPNLITGLTGLTYPQGLAVDSLSEPEPSFGTFNAPFGWVSHATAKLHPAGGADLDHQSATITWGDGEITKSESVELSSPSGDPSEVDVLLAHRYWMPGRRSVHVTLTNHRTGTTETFRGHAIVHSRYAGLGDSYSSGEGAGWPYTQDHPDLPGCDRAVYNDPSGYPVHTDHINGAESGQVVGYGSNFCTTQFLEPPSETNPWTGNTCHRARTAYAHVVQSKLATRIPGLRLRFVACSGAVTRDAYVAKKGSPFYLESKQFRRGENPQADQSTLTHNVSLITLSFGGNDLGFAPLAAACVKSNLPPPLGSPPPGGSGLMDCLDQDRGLLSTLGYNTKPGGSFDGDFDPAPRGFTPVVGQPADPSAAYRSIQQRGVEGPVKPYPLKSLATASNGSDTLIGSHCQDPSDPACFHGDLHDALVLLYRALKAQSPGARILVSGYPRFFQNPGFGGNGGCEHFAAFEQDWVNDRVALANAVIKDAVMESGVAEYVDVYRALAGHEECTGDGLNVGGPNAVFYLDPDTFEVTGSCAGNWINPIDVASQLYGNVIPGEAEPSAEILHPNPCGDKSWGESVASAYDSPRPKPIDSFALRSGEGQTTSLFVQRQKRDDWRDRLNVTVNGTGNLWPFRFTLKDPKGRTYKSCPEGQFCSCPTGRSIYCPVQRGPVYATWDVPHPIPGTWSLRVKNFNDPGSGEVKGSIMRSFEDIPSLPPAGKITVLGLQCGITTQGRYCNATLRANVANTGVARYEWFGSDGLPRSNTSGSKNNTVTLTYEKNLDGVILRTVGTNGETRYTTWRMP